MTLKIGEVEVQGIMDTGSVVTTLSEGLYHELMEGQDLSPVPSVMRLVAANGLDLPLLGYFYCDVKVNGVLVEEAVILVTKDRSGCSSPKCLIGMNILKKLPGFTHNHCARTVERKIKIIDPAFIPANSVQNVRVACGDKGLSSMMMIEPAANPPRRGVFMLPAVSDVLEGTVIVPIANTTEKDIILPQKTFLGRATSGFVEKVSLTVNSTDVGSSCQAPDEKGGEPCANRPGGGEGYSQLNESGISFNENLLAYQHRALQDLVVSNRDVFAWSDDDLGYTDLIKHRIHLLDERPVAQPYRTLPPSCLKEVEAHIEDLLHRGIIQPSYSPFAAPIVVVRKKDGSIRLCCDFRKINSKTHKDCFPLPRIDECLNAVGGASIFSSLDLHSGYYQVAMHEDDMHKTAFVCPFGLFEYTRLPFGLMNAPATFQRLMQTTMSEYIYRILLVYLDDLLVFSKNFEEHLDSLQKVFKRLREIGVKLKPSKCQFGQEKVTFLGHTICADGIGTMDDKIRAITDWPEPRTLKQVRSFLGTAGYYRRFVKDYSKTAKPLTDLINKVHQRYPHDKKKGESRMLGDLWTSAEQAAMLELKKALTTAPVLAFPDYERPFHLELDASDKGLGAVLMQDRVDGQKGRQVVAYASRTLHNAEKEGRYSSRKLELVALKWAISERFRSYLLGHKFTAYTDNNPLTHLMDCKLGAVEQRWVSELAIFDFDIKYKPGKSNLGADGLSRNPVDPPPENPETLLPVSSLQMQLHVSNLLEFTDTCRLPDCLVSDYQSFQVNAVTLQPTTPPSVSADVQSLSSLDLAAAQQADPVISQLFAHVRAGTIPPKPQRKASSPAVRQYLRQIKKLVIRDDVIYRVNKLADGGAVAIIPSSMVPRVLQLAHDDCGHQGSERTYQILARRCYFPNMLTAVQEHCRKCERCQRAKRATALAQIPGHLSASRPFEVVAMDFLTIEPDRNGREHVLVLTDVFTKISVAADTPDQTARSAANVLLKHWIPYYGVPSCLHSDNARAFTGSVIGHLCELYGIKQSTTTTYYPQGNGQAERFNRTLCGMLASLEPHQKCRWTDYLSSVVFAYNATPHRTTGQSPFALVFGQEPNLPLDLYLGAPLRQVDETCLPNHLTRLRELREIARQGIASHQKDPPPTRNAPSIKEGDTVLVRSHPLGRTKIADKFGPEHFKVVEIPTADHNRFLIESLDSGVRKSSHGSNLKKVPTRVGNSESAPRSDQDSNLVLDSELGSVRKSVREKKPNQKYSDFITNFISVILDID